MSDVRPQSLPEKPQQELRFTAREPILDEALAMLEKDGERKSEYLPGNLFLYAMKRISIDLSDTYDGHSLNHSTFTQYRQAVDSISMRGRKTFKLDSWMKPLHAGGPDGSLIGVGLRVRVDPTNVDRLIAPPLYGPNHYNTPLTAEQLARVEAGKNILGTAREAQYIPVRYEIGSTVDNPTEALERLQGILELGTWVSQLTIVPAYPRSARHADIYREGRMDRTYERIDQRFAAELLPPTAPINIVQSEELPKEDENLRDVS
ncbi:MAG: hypothetical protein JWO99_561 [Candidatus Saccharibacteria bacterium]|nr:hypothetical protein [Candidatus Saccharibacteria bacterium]